MRAPVVLFVLGVVVRTVWYVLYPQNADWDPAYYASVARTIAATGHATTDVIWNYTWLPESLTHPADMHWMPLPSRILVPLVAVSPSHGAGWTNILLGACWGPLAWEIAGRLGRPDLDRWVAGMLGGLGFSHIALSSIPDSVALAGVLGGLIVLSAADKRPWLAAFLCACFALTRNDGFLLAPCVALAFRGRAIMGVALSGPLASAAWFLRCWRLGGEDWVAGRRLASQAVEGGRWMLGMAEPLSLVDRLHFAATTGLGQAVFHVVIVLPLLATVLLVVRRERWARGLAIYWFGAPLLLPLLAPAVSTSGSVFRSGAAMIPLAAALCGWGLGELGRWSERARDLHPAFLALLAALGWTGFVWYANPVLDMAKGAPPNSCQHALEAETPVFSAHPLLAAGDCGRGGLLIRAGMDLPRVEALSDRYGVRHVVADPREDEVGLGVEELRALLVGWDEVAPGVFERR